MIRRAETVFEGIIAHSPFAAFVLLIGHRA
jgi:hypothetical protein